MNGRFITDTDYPAVRRVMGPERETLADAELETLLAELFPGAEAEDVENFMRTMQQFGRQVAPVAQRALPGIIQGAATGAAVGGPWGALLGAVGGGVTGALGGGPPGAPGRPPVPAAPPIGMPAPPAGPVAMPQPVGPAPAMAAPGMPGAATNIDIAQLLALLSRPETIQALLAMLMQSAGRPTVAVGNRNVPPPAFANAVAELAAAATESLPIPSGGGAGFLMDSQGYPRIDVANPADRARLLLADLAQVAWAEAEEEEDVADDTDSDDAEWFDDWFADETIDPLDSYYDALAPREFYVR